MADDSGYVQISGDELRRLLEEQRRLREQVAELQAHSTAALEAGLPRTVRRFHERYGHPVRHTPAVSTDDEVRFRLALITEEYKELLDACGTYWDANHSDPITVDLPELVDAIGDLMWVLEGTAAVLGVQMGPVIREIARANMSKEPNGAGKPIKPEGWEPPDVVGCLIAQGWRPT
jgi:predicted HAD superfamily Cof-like phosphohydrolase